MISLQPMARRRLAAVCCVVALAECGAMARHFYEWVVLPQETGPVS